MEARDRSLTIDSLRGVILLSMFLNHLARFFSQARPVIDYHYSFLGVLTTAELFLAISAYVIVQSYRDRDGVIYDWPILVIKAKTRFKKLYFAHIAVLLVVVLMSIFSDWNLGEFNNTDLYLPLKRLIFGGLFLMQAAVIDILPMYLFLTILNPFIFLGFKNKKGYLVLLISLFVWASVYYFNLSITNRYTQYVVLPYFNLLGWQFLYVCLIYFFLKSQVILKYRKLSLILSLYMSLVFFIYKHWFNFLPLDVHVLTSIRDMGIVRVVNSLNVVCLLFCLQIGFRANLVSRAMSWVGRNTLILFCLHVICFYAHMFFTLVPSQNWSFEKQIMVYLAYVISPVLILLSVEKIRTIKWKSLCL